MKKACLRKQGFTFIEILVVITIIGVLTLVATTNFAVVNKKARDGKRKGDLEQIKAALEMYRTDEKVYPTTAIWNGFGGGSITGETYGTVYMEDIPDDPMENYSYKYSSGTGATYNLCALMEVDTGGPNCVPNLNCKTGPTVRCNYGVTNPL